MCLCRRFKCLRESIFFGKSDSKRIWFPANHILSEMSTVKNCIQICLTKDRFSWRDYLPTMARFINALPEVAQVQEKTFGKTYSPIIWFPENLWIWFTRKQIQLLKTENMLSRRHLNLSSTKTYFLTVASRPPCLQWHRLQWHFSDFLIGLFIVKKVWILWHSKLCH